MKILALVESPEHVCCRYRIQAFAAALEDAGWTLTCQGLEGGAFFRPLQLRRAANFDAVILQRKLLPSWQLHLLRRAAEHLVFDFDDAVLYRDSYDARGLHSRGRARRFAQTVCMADTVIAGNDFLADCALRAGAPVARVHVIPTCVDPRLYPVARHDASGARVDLVWIGSASTLQGIEQSRAIWERVSRALPQARMRLICDRMPESFPIPLVPVAWSRETEAYELAASHIGVSFLPDDLWSRGKCGLKVLQYQAAGLPVVANPVGAHCEMVRSGETGMLATTPDEWSSALQELARDARLRQQMGYSARQSVESNYSVAAWADTFVSSTTGTLRKSNRSSWMIDRGPHSARPVFEPHATKLRSSRSFNEIGGR
jgi:glycosyltransferase involved in cell wall biosynthesis